MCSTVPCEVEHRKAAAFKFFVRWPIKPQSVSFMMPLLQRERVPCPSFQLPSRRVELKNDIVGRFYFVEQLYATNVPHSRRVFLLKT